MDLRDGLFRTILLSHLYGHIGSRTILQHNMLPQHRKRAQTPSASADGDFSSFFFYHCKAALRGSYIPQQEAVSH